MEDEIDAGREKNEDTIAVIRGLRGIVELLKPDINPDAYRFKVFPIGNKRLLKE